MAGRRNGRHVGHRPARRGVRPTTVCVAALVAVALVVAVVFAASAGRSWLTWPPRRAGSAAATAGSRAGADAGADGSGTVPASGEVDRTAVPEPNARIGRQRGMDALGDEIRARLAGYQGDWQVYVEDLASGASVSIDPHAGYAASVIKLYVMLAVFQRMADGAMADDASTNQLLTQMITVSSNEATNTLVSALGGGDMNAGFSVVNEIAARYGFGSSHISQALGVVPIDPDGKVTTADDAGRFMAAVYRGSLVNADSSRRMLDLLLGQTRRAKIPAGVPAGTVVANKTGENTGVENDAAVVFAGADTTGAIDGSATQGDYVLVVMSSGVDAGAAQASIRDLSAMVWDAMHRL